MTAEELRTACGIRDIGVNALGRLVGVAQRQAARWWSGDEAVPSSVEALLAVAIQYDLSESEVATAVLSVRRKVESMP